MKSISILMVEDHKLLRVGLRSLFNDTDDIKKKTEGKYNKWSKCATEHFFIKRYEKRYCY